MSDSYLLENINSILSIARLAPSVHNSQPWKVRVEGDHLLVQLDESRLLDVGDPTGRQGFISLGIFTEACAIGLEAVGLKAADVNLKGKTVTLRTVRSGSSQANEDQRKALKERFTDRSIYKEIALTGGQKTQIASSWPSAKVEIKVNNDPKIIEAVASLTKQALRLALSRPDFRKELAAYLVSSNKRPEGIPLSTLGTRPIRTTLTKQLVRSGLSRKSDAQLEYRRWRSASGLVFILASGDSPDFWLESGRAYLKASLAIQRLGLSQATSAAIVEAADFHEDIEKMLGTEKRIQCLLRIGQGQKKQRRSGRRPSENILIT
jgi:hypothetical protein